MDIQRQGFLSIDQLTERYHIGGKGAQNNTAPNDGATFGDILKQKGLDGEEIRFSKHAAGRLQDRGIEISDSQMERLSDGVKRARMKGIKDSLVIVDELAFIVNVPNQTVVTAMTSADARENVFTNINGAVIN